VTDAAAAIRHRPSAISYCSGIGLGDKRVAPFELMADG